MKRAFRSTAFVALLAVLSACPDDPPPDPRFAPIVESLRRELESNEATAVSAAVWLDGEVRWIGGFGHADGAAGPAPGERTVFMIGSDTKKITALSLLRKVAVGRTSLDATVGALLPKLKMEKAPAFPQTTLRQLLHHQSGISEGEEITTSTTDAALAAFAYGTFAANHVQLAPPGLFYNYNNPGYSIAGLIDQELDGRPWADIVTQDLFVPLRMTRTFARRSEVDRDHAVGHQLDDPARPVPLEALHESAFGRPNGLLWSTPSDQARLAAFLVGGNPAILPDAWRAELTKGQVAMHPGEPPGYSFGLVVGRGVQLEGDFHDVPIWSHGGRTGTHSSTFFVLPDQRFAISILSNGPRDTWTGSVVAAIRALVPLPPSTTPPRRPFNVAELDALAGTYVEPYEIGDVHVTRQQDRLVIELPAFDATGIPYERELTPLTTRVWLARIDGEIEELTFIDGLEGETYLRARTAVAVKRP